MLLAGALACVGEIHALRGPSFCIFAVLTLMTRSEIKPATQVNRAYFTEGCRLYREYIFYVLAFNAVERIGKQFFFMMLHFSYQYCIGLRLTKISNLFVLCMRNALK